MGRILQVRDVPDDVYARLQERARAQGVSLAESVRASLVEQAKRPTMAEMLERLKEWEPVDPGESSADAIRAGRAERGPSRSGRVRARRPPARPRRRGALRR